MTECTVSSLTNYGTLNQCSSAHLFNTGTVAGGTYQKGISNQGSFVGTGSIGLSTNAELKNTGSFLLTVDCSTQTLQAHFTNLDNGGTITIRCALDHNQYAKIQLDAITTTTDSKIYASIISNHGSNELVLNGYAYRVEFTSEKVKFLDFSVDYLDLTGTLKL